MYSNLRKRIGNVKLFSSNWDTGVPRAFALGADATVEFSQVRVRMLDGTLAPLS